MSKRNFITLLRKIEDCNVFQNNSTCEQAPVEFQLMVTMANLGLSGNGGSLGIIAHMFDIGG